MCETHHERLWRPERHSSAYRADYTQYALTDHQFSVVALISDSAALIERISYTPYGEARHQPNHDVDGDGDVDAADGTLATAAYSGGNNLIYQSNYNPDADFDRDGDVDSNDTVLTGSTYYKAALPPGWLSSGGWVGEQFNTIGYCGYVFNQEAGGAGNGLYTVRFRHYDPANGRWISRDPAGYMDSMSLYGYGTGSPLGEIDPMGLSTGGIEAAHGTECSSNNGGGGQVASVSDYEAPSGASDMAAGRAIRDPRGRTPIAAPGPSSSGPRFMIHPNAPRWRPAHRLGSVQQPWIYWDWGGAWQGAVDGLAMFANAATFHQIESLNTYVNNVLDENDGWYAVGNVFMHVSAYAAYAAGAVRLIEVVFFEGDSLLIEIGGPNRSGGLLQIRPTGEPPLFRLDYHPLEPGGPSLPHIDSPPLGWQHWPWNWF